MKWLCNACDGSGEGMWDRTICPVCKGIGSEPDNDDNNDEEE